MNKFCFTPRHIIAITLGMLLSLASSNIQAVKKTPRKPKSEAYTSKEAKPELQIKSPAKYPEAALANCQSATVWVLAYVDQFGDVTDAKIAVASKFDLGFEQAAISAARKSKFRPAIKAGRLTAMWATFSYDFNPPENCTPTKDNTTQTPPPKTGKFVAVETQPKFIDRATPKYPKEALENCLEGVVYVSVLVDKNGKVRDAKIFKSSRPNVGFEVAAQEAARNSKFSPAIQEGFPIAVWANFDYKFKLTSDCRPLVRKRASNSDSEENDKEEWEPSFPELTVASDVELDQEPTFAEFKQPRYPRLARKKRAQGIIEVKVLIDESGDVREAELATSGKVNRHLKKAALGAAEWSVFHPAIKNGLAVPVWATFPIIFKLGRNKNSNQEKETPEPVETTSSPAPSATTSFETSSPQATKIATDTFVAIEVQPKFIEKVKPIYPRLAQQAGIQGVVYISVLVGVTGKVLEAKIAKSSGTNAGLEEAALAAALKCKFSPALSKGYPIEVWATFDFRFRVRTERNR